MGGRSPHGLQTWAISFIMPNGVSLWASFDEVRDPETTDFLNSEIEKNRPFESHLAFEFCGNELMFTWNPTWWTMAQKIVKAIPPMRKLSRKLQDKQATLGDAIGMVIDSLEETKTELHALALGVHFTRFLS